MVRQLIRKFIVLKLLGIMTLLSLSTPCCESKAQETEIHFGVQGAITKFADEMKEAGVEITREWINWEEIEPVKGRYNWAPMDEKVLAANRAGIEILGYFVKMPFWAKKTQKDTKPPLPHKKPLKVKKGKKDPRLPLEDKKGGTCEFCEPKDINDFRRFAKAVAERYDGKHGHGEMKYIGILNEVTLPEYFDIKNTDYEPWLINGYEGVKEGNPDIKVLIGAFINPLDAKEFVDKMLRDYNRYYDIVNFHVYGQNDTLVTEATRYLKSRMQLYNVSKPMWLTETSAVLHYGSREIQDSVARAVVKRYARAFGEGVEKVFWFTFVGLPTAEEDGRGTEQKTVGLGWALKTEYIFHPRQAYYTYKLMTAELKGFDYAEKISDTQYKFDFSDKNTVYVLWGEGTLLPPEITGTVKVTDYLGNEQLKEAAELVLTEAPIFLQQ